MSAIGEAEKPVQRRVAKLFVDELGYDHHGNLIRVPRLGLRPRVLRLARNAAKGLPPMNRILIDQLRRPPSNGWRRSRGAT